MAVTIQATSKPWKACQLAGITGILIGIGALFYDLPNAGLVLLVGGLGTFTAGKIGAWWYHA